MKISNKTCKETINVVINSMNDPAMRNDVSESLGFSLSGASPLKPDLWDMVTAVYGTFNRVGMEPPPIHADKLRGLEKFVDNLLLSRKVPILPADFDLSTEWWLSETKYPEWRKAELREAEKTYLDYPSKEDWKLKGFPKDEFYLEAKSERNILPRGDAAKVFEGPPIKAVEIAIKDCFPEFIKPIPVVDRPGYILDRLYIPGAKYAATDYTAFESHFVKQIMLAVEFKLYKHVLQNHPEGMRRLVEIQKRMTGKNYCRFKHFNLTLEATRMSGEMCTSLGNGFSNLVFFLYACHVEGITCTGVIEGDDGLFVCSPKIPDQKTFIEMGLTIKLEEHTSLETASFCGIIFDKIDKINITDPMEVLLTFGWSKRYHVGMNRIRHLELLRAKSLSFAYQYQGCPIIQELAHAGLRVTKHVDLRRYLNNDRSLNMWEREQLLEALETSSANNYQSLKRDIPMNTRNLMMDKFGIEPSDQIEIENYLAALDTIRELDHVTIQKYYKPIWEYFDAFYTHYGEESLYPTLNVPQYHGQLYKDFGDHIVFTTQAENSGVKQYVVN